MLQDYAITIAVMGCRVYGPGETDEADLGALVRSNSRSISSAAVKALGAFTTKRSCLECEKNWNELIQEKSGQVSP